MKWKKLRGISPLIATIVLIAITVSAGLVIYTVFLSGTRILSTHVQVMVVASDLVKSRDFTLLSVSLKNEGNVPVYASISCELVPNNLDAMRLPVPCDGRNMKGLVYYTAVNVPSGTYTFTFGGDDGAEVFIRGPGLNGWVGLHGRFVWGPVNHSIALQGGIYEIVCVLNDGCWNGYSNFSGSLPVSQINWLIVAYRGYGQNWPSYNTVKNDPLDMSRWGGRVIGAIMTQTDGTWKFNIDWRDGVRNVPPIQGDTAMPIGWIEPGQTKSRTFILNSGYAGNPVPVSGEKYVVKVAAFEANGNLAYSKPLTLTCSGT